MKIINTRVEFFQIKQNRQYLLGIVLTLFSVFQLNAQRQVSKNFGLDADQLKDTALSSSGHTCTFASPPAQGTSDWFPKKFRSGDFGFWAIDTNGASVIKAAGASYGPFEKKMSVQPYTKVDTNRYIWAAYLRDQVGTDNTTFTGGDKNGDNPETNWGYPGPSPPDKNDLVDGAVFVMRGGLDTSAHLLLYGSSTIFANNGDRNIDYELFRTKASISGGAFVNTGDDDGHSAWIFDKSTGALKRYGDLLVSVAGSGTNVNLISLRIWMKKSTHDSMVALTHPKPSNFNLSGVFEVSTSGVYGYAEVTQPASCTVEFFYGQTSSTLGNTPAQPWGTYGKSGGTSGWRANDNFAGQFLEFGIDLTYMGVDPFQFKTVDTGDWCNPSFGSIMIKSRTSSSFNSALKDFIGPASFVLPDISVNAIPLSGLDCVSTTACAKITDDTGTNLNNWYEWVNTNNINTVLDTGKYFCTTTPGTYKVYGMRGEGCRRVDSTATFVIAQDITKPVSYAQVFDTLIDGAVYTVTVHGDSSQYFTDLALAVDSATFGPSGGLTYAWKGMDVWNNFYTSTLMNPGVSDTGFYRLIVTEPRNGCKDTSQVLVMWLPVEWGNFSCNVFGDNKVNLNWSTLSENGVKIFEVQRFNTNRFETIGNVAPAGNSELEHFYNFTDNKPLNGRNFYRIKMVADNGVVEYSDYCESVIQGKSIEGLSGVTLYPNPAGSNVTITVTGVPADGAELTLMDQSGRTISQLIMEGNIISMDISNLSSGIYLMKVEGAGISETQKLIKK